MIIKIISVRTPLSLYLQGFAWFARGSHGLVRTEKTAETQGFARTFQFKVLCNPQISAVRTGYISKIYNTAVRTACIKSSIFVSRTLKNQK